MKNTLKKGGADDFVIAEITPEAIKARQPIEVRFHWGYFYFDLFSTAMFINGNKDNDWKSTVTLSPKESLDILVFLTATSRILADYSVIPVEPKEFSTFYSELVRNIDSYQIFIGDMVWEREEFQSGVVDTFYKANYDLDSNNLKEEIPQLINKTMKGQVKIPVFNVVMNIEKAYIYLLVLATVLLVYLNSQLRLVNAGLEVTDFEKCSLTSWKVLVNKGWFNAFPSYIEASVATIGYTCAVTTPLAVIYYANYFNSEFGEAEFHIVIKAAIFFGISFLVLASLKNVYKIITKPYQII